MKIDDEPAPWEDPLWTSARDDFKGLGDAIAKGVLLDVSDLAAEVGYPCPTFITKQLFEARWVESRMERVKCLLDDSALMKKRIHEGNLGYTMAFAARNGEMWFGDEPRYVVVGGVVEIFENVGLVAILGDEYESLDFKPHLPGRARSFVD